MTIAFRPDELVLSNLPLGKKVTLRVIAYAHDDKVQAVATWGVLSLNKNPHITISVNRKQGGKPNDSNEMLGAALANDKLRLANNNIDLEGVIDVFPRTTTQPHKET